MKLRDFSEESNIEEAGGIIDRKVLSKVGTKRSKKSAETRVLDQQRAEQLWDSFLEVTGGGKEFNIRELISWLRKEVRIDGINIDDEIIQKALDEAPAVSGNVQSAEPKADKKEPEKPAADTKTAEPEKKEPVQHPASGGFVSLDLPALAAADRDWVMWADELAKAQPQLFMKIAKALGAKVQSSRRAS